MILLDLFSGTGGFHKGLSDAGFNFRQVYYSEIDKHAIANYKNNYPNAKHIGSVENIIHAGIQRPDIITFGSPCQDFSLAGNRKGLVGERSGLIQQAITAISYFHPDIFIWENVKGTFSSNSCQDFWAIIQAFANIGGYELEWQLVNTSWILPQNRERIYLIGHATTAFRSWRSVFPISERSEIYNESYANKEEIHENSLTITTKGQSNWTGSFIKITGRTGKGQSGIVLNEEGISRCLTVGNYDVPKISVRADEDEYIKVEDRANTNRKDKTSTLDSNGYQRVIQLNPNKEFGNMPQQQNRIYDAKGISPAIATDTRSPIVVASRGRAVSCLTPKRTEYGKAIRKDYEKGLVKEKRKFIQQLEPRVDGLTNTLTSVQKDNLLQYGLSIRRLTEIECERLQGFPDNWTQYGNYDDKVKAIPKTQRYKLIGNAVTAKMVQLIGKRLIVNYDFAKANEIP